MDGIGYRFDKIAQFLRGNHFACFRVKFTKGELGDSIDSDDTNR